MVLQERRAVQAMNNLPKMKLYGLAWNNAKGQIHRDVDLPAIIWWDGSLFYYKNDVYHRDDDLPAVIWPDGSVSYWNNGEQYKP
jgi:hypothetical protein